MPKKPASVQSEYDAEYDGNSKFILHLDDKGSVIIYFPSIGLPQTQTAELEASLAASETSAECAPQDERNADNPCSRRQWVAVLPGRPLGWDGPRRWNTASWKLLGEVQLRPILDILSAVEAAVATLVAEPGIETAVSALDVELDALGDLPQPRIHETYNSVLVNRYLDGRAGIKWHSDNEKWYKLNGQNDMVIGSVSLGEERWFELCTMKQKSSVPKTVRLRLKSGSLLIMAGSTQELWQHRLPTDDNCTAVRYNLTFRRVATVQESPELANAGSYRDRQAADNIKSKNTLKADCVQGDAASTISLNSMDLPRRPGVPVCSFYMKTGKCKFGTGCKWDHPEPRKV